MLRYISALLIALFVSTPFSGTALAADTAFDFSFENIDGGSLSLNDYRGKVLLVVNTATECGNTHQLGTLQKAWSAYRDQGLVVVGVPSNDFGQEPRKGQEIADFCTTNYQVDFPMAELTSVRGDGANPFFKWIKAELGDKGAPSWNFFKYLIGRDGKVIDFFGTVEDPLQSPLRPSIEAALKN